MGSKKSTLLNFFWRHIFLWNENISKFHHQFFFFSSSTANDFAFWVKRRYLKTSIGLFLLALFFLSIIPESNQFMQELAWTFSCTVRSSRRDFDNTELIFDRKHSTVQEAVVQMAFWQCSNSIGGGLRNIRHSHTITGDAKRADFWILSHPKSDDFGLIQFSNLGSSVYACFEKSTV